MQIFFTARTVKLTIKQALLSREHHLLMMKWSGQTVAGRQWSEIFRLKVLDKNKRQKFLTCLCQQPRAKFISTLHRNTQTLLKPHAQNQAQIYDGGL